MHPKKRLFGLYLLIVLAIAGSACTQERSLKGLTIRSLVLKDDNGDLVRTAIMDELITSGAVQSMEKGVDLVGDVKWEGTGDRPMSLYVTIVSGEKSEYSITTSAEVKRAIGAGPMNDKTFARVAATNIVDRVAEQFATQRTSAPPPQRPQSNPRPPGG